MKRSSAFACNHKQPFLLPRYVEMCHDGTNATICSGIMLKNNENSVEYTSYS